MAVLLPLPQAPAGQAGVRELTPDRRTSPLCQASGSQAASATSSASWTGAATSSAPCPVNQYTKCGPTALLHPPPSKPGSAGPWTETRSWMNGYGKLGRMTDRNPAIVEFYLYLYLAATFVTVRQLIQRARTRYR